MFERMILCRDCRQRVSRSAKWCPSCGCRNPAVQQWMYVAAASIVGVVFLLVAIAILLSGR